MDSAFVLADETILCRQTPDGWRPLTVALTAMPSDTASDGVSSTPMYQVGCVPLFLHVENHQATDHPSTLSQDTDHRAPDASTFAISYAYALDRKIDLPDIVDADVDISKVQADLSDAAAFIPYRQLITQLPYTTADTLSQAIQLLRWQSDTQFCSRCGNPATLAALGERAMVCDECGLRQYPRVQPCVITAITRPNPKTGETQILLAHHHRYGKSVLPMQYGLIAGFVEVGESLEHAVSREVMEEVGITLTDINYVSSQPWPYPSNLMMGFRASYSGGDIVLQVDELSHADFFDLSNLPKIPSKGSIAYDLIAQIIEEANEPSVTL